MNVFLNEPSQPTRFFSLDPNGKEKQPKGLYLTGYTRGYYGQTNDLPKRMAAFAKKNRLVFTGPVYNIYLFDEMSITDMNQYLLQVSASVKETRRVPSRRPVRR
jgi:effector-binding domain-containing protein